MKHLFGMDGKITILLGKIADLVLLNLLWLLASLPVVTAGAAATALYTVVLKMTRNEESYICASFFRAFRDNLRQATKIWLIILAGIAVLYFDFYYSAHAAGAGAKFLMVPLGMAAFLLAVLYSYIFPILAYFENDTKKAVKNALLMGIAYLPFTAVILIVNICPLLILFTGNPIVTVFADLVIGFSLAAYINAHLLGRLFEKTAVKKKEAA